MLMRSWWPVVVNSSFTAKLRHYRPTFVMLAGEDAVGSESRWYPDMIMGQNATDD